MKLLYLLAIPFTLNASVEYVGDSIAHGYRLATRGVGITEVGASPREVFRMLQRSKGSDTVVLSTGASNDCNDITGVKRNIEFAQHKYHSVYILDAPKCGGLIKTWVHPITFTPGPDGVHPRRYRVLEIPNGSN